MPDSSLCKPIAKGESGIYQDESREIPDTQVQDLEGQNLGLHQTRPPNDLVGLVLHPEIGSHIPGLTDRFFQKSRAHRTQPRILGSVDLGSANPTQVRRDDL